MTMTQSNAETKKALNELDWVRAETYEGVKVETFREKFVRKVTENPMVPIGTLSTVAALSFGIWSFYKGNSLMSQYMMRARVAAQGFTILSMAVGFLLMAKKTNT